MVLACWLGGIASGCLRIPKMLEAEYFQPRRTLTVRVADCPSSPTLETDQPEGNVVSATWLMRQDTMRKRMSGISADRVRRAVERELAHQLGDLFAIVPADAQLALEVSVDEWGWSVRTGNFGQSTDVRYFRIGGTASILDLAQDRKRVCFASGIADTPLGDPPTKETCEATLPGAAQDFAAQIVLFIRKGKPE